MYLHLIIHACSTTDGDLLADVHTPDAADLTDSDTGDMENDKGDMETVVIACVATVCTIAFITVVIFNAIIISRRLK